MHMRTRSGTRPDIYTIGHSNRSLREFVALLTAHGIGQIIDVRTVPRSRHNPQFNEKRLALSLKKHNIRYVRLESLGGFRHAKKDSKNTGWRNLSFRGFADYMATEEFNEGLATLESLARKRRSAVMCAEALPWRCHRSLIADALTKRRWDVFTIMSPSNAPKHKLTPFLKVKNGVLTYPAEKQNTGMIRYRYKGAKLLFVGINPHHGSYARGIPFSNNKLFWYLLAHSGILPESRDELRDDNILRRVYRSRFGGGEGLGFVNMVDRPSHDVTELKPGEEIRGRSRLLRAIRNECPRVVCFIGKIAYEKFSGSKAFDFGWQANIGDSRVFVMHFPQHGPAAVRVRELRIAAKAARIPLYR